MHIYRAPYTSTEGYRGAGLKPASVPPALCIILVVVSYHTIFMNTFILHCPIMTIAADRGRHWAQRQRRLEDRT